MVAFSTYELGTVSVSNGSTTVTGDGVIWSGVNARSGDTIYIDGEQNQIVDVTDDTHLELVLPATAGKAGVSYVIVWDSPLRFTGAQPMVDVSRLISTLNTKGLLWYLPAGYSQPSDVTPALTADEGQAILKIDTGALWVMQGGSWVAAGTFKGFNYKGAYNAATTYAINDVLTSSGNAYVVTASTTGNAPPNASYYDVLASKGDAGATGATGPQGAGYGGTSATSLLIGTGSRVFTTQAGLAYTDGARVRASSAADTSNWMEGVATYSGTTLTIDVSKTNGAGTFADWNLNVVGEPGAGDLSSANHLTDVTVTQDGTGAVPRIADTKINEILSVKDFGAVGDGVTADTAAFGLALDAMDSLDRPLHIPAGRYILDAKIIKTFTNRAVFITDGRGATILEWTNADGGLDLTYSDQRKPPHIGSMSLLTSSAGGGTALHITSPVLATSFSEGVVVDHVEVAGSDVASDYWTNGIHLTNCWYPLVQSPTVKGLDEVAPPFSMGTGIIGEECQAIRIRDYTGQHMSDGYATIGTGSGEGLSVIGGELVGVYRGINHARTSPTAGSHIANIHINAYYRCIILNNILDMNVHDCLLYKTHVSFEDCQGIELVGCYQCDVHDNQIACPGVGTTGGGTQLGITGVNSTDNKIHHNQFAQWPSSGGQGVFMTTGCARNLVSDNSRSFNEGSPDPVVYFTGADKSNIARNNQPMATQTFAASDATPSVGNALHDFFSTANTSSTTITAFDDGYSGQRITVMMNDLYTGFTNNPGLLLKNGANVAVGAGAGCTISFIFDGQNARWIETSRGF